MLWLVCHGGPNCACWHSLPCEFGVLHEARLCISGFISGKTDLMVKPFLHQKFLFNLRHELGFVVFETVRRGVDPGTICLLTVTKMCSFPQSECCRDTRRRVAQASTICARWDSAEPLAHSLECCCGRGSVLSKFLFDHWHETGSVFFGMRVALGTVLHPLSRSKCKNHQDHLSSWRHDRLQKHRLSVLWTPFQRHRHSAASAPTAPSRFPLQKYGWRRLRLPRFGTTPIQIEQSCCNAFWFSLTMSVEPVFTNISVCAVPCFHRALLFEYCFSSAVPHVSACLSSRGPCLLVSCFGLAYRKCGEWTISRIADSITRSFLGRRAGRRLHITRLLFRTWVSRALEVMHHKESILCCFVL